MELNDEIINFLNKQKVVLVLTLDEHGKIHCAAKGIVDIKKAGKIFLIDLFSGRTMRNLIRNPEISITAIDEKNFTGYTLQGKAKIIDLQESYKDYVAKWEDLLFQRISDRIADNVKLGKRSKAALEAKFFTKPKHLIEIDVENVIDMLRGHVPY